VKSATEEPHPDIPEATPTLPPKENSKLIFKPKKSTARRKEFAPNASAQ